MNKTRVSIAMAVHNGEKYLEEQITSILLNMSDNDELIISDDGSTDRTIPIIKSYNDNRIKLFTSIKAGVKQNFDNAIKNTSGKYIFLSDQDDIWRKNKIDKVLEVFRRTNCTCVLHNAEIVDENLLSWKKDFFTFRNSQPGYLRNILKNSYIGCCMAFDVLLKDFILPIPNTIEMHDQWIGLISEKIGKSEFINECLIKYRRHGMNFSKMEHHSLSTMFSNRVCLLKELRDRLYGNSLISEKKWLF